MAEPYPELRSRLQALRNAVKSEPAQETLDRALNNHPSPASVRNLVAQWQWFEAAGMLSQGEYDRLKVVADQQPTGTEKYGGK